MSRSQVREILEMLRSSLQDDDTEDVALYIGFDKYMQLVEAYVKLRELIKE